MLRNLFAPLAMKISAGLILALALLAGVQTVRLANARASLSDLKADYARQAAETALAARKADAAGIEAAQAGKASSEAEIDRAREAAEGSDDPWDSAIKAMKGARP